MPQIFYELILIVGLYILLMIAVYVYKLFNTEGNIRAYYKKRLIVNSITLIFVAVLWIIFSFLFQTGSLTGGVSLPASSIGPSPYRSVGRVDSGFPVEFTSPQYPYNEGASVSDTREFTKKSFDATLRTRKVEDTAKKVEVLISGVGGRIDSSNITEKYASIGFVVPKSKLNAFEEQLRSYTNKKFYTQAVSSQNLLGEKKNIEQNQSTANSSIDAITARKNLAQDNYTKQASSVKSQISSKTAALKNAESIIAALENDLASITDASSREAKEEQIRQQRQNVSSLNNDIGRLRADLSNIEATFKSEMANLNLSLDQQNQILSNLNKTEGEFFENVETVQGHVYLGYISVWEIITLYSPINPAFIIAIIGIVIRMYFLHKREQRISSVQ